MYITYIFQLSAYIAGYYEFMVKSGLMGYAEAYFELL